MINFSLISELDKKRNTVNLVLDGLKSVKHSEGREARLDKWPIQCSIAGCEGWHYLDYVPLFQQIGRFPAITLEYLPKWVAQSASHKTNEKQLFISIYIYYLLSTCITLSNDNIQYLLY